MTSTLAQLEELQSLRVEVRNRRVEPWLNDPLQWVTDVLPSVSLSGYQADELSGLVTGSGKVAARGPRGSGKTMPAALAALWFITTRELAGLDWKCPITAGSWQQLQRFTMPEIHKWTSRMRWDRLGMDPWRRNQELMTLRVNLKHGEAFAINSDNPDLIEGAHADHLMLIVDEAKSVPDASWDAMEGYFSSPGQYYRFVISTPSEPAGRFADIHMRKPGYQDWTATHVTITDAIDAGRVTEGWQLERAAAWGTESVLYRCHVLAEFAGSEDGVIPLSWVEAAMQRAQPDKTVCRIVGVDVADTGSDQTVIAYRDGNVIYRLDRFETGDTMLTADRVENRTVNGTRIVVDSIGVGAGVAAKLKRNKQRVVQPFVASAGTPRRDKSGEMGFANLRAAAWWNLRELLDPASDVELVLPDDGELLGDLTAPTWREVAGGKILIESKADIKKRLGRSTDVGDAVVQAMWEDHTAIDLSGWADDLTQTGPMFG
jgi:hypothetical protein